MLWASSQPRIYLHNYFTHFPLKPRKAGPRTGLTYLVNNGRQERHSYTVNTKAKNPVMVGKRCTEHFTVQQLQLSTATFFQPRKLKKSKLYKCWKNIFELYWLQIGRDHQGWNTLTGDSNKTLVTFSKIFI